MQHLWKIYFLTTLLGSLAFIAGCLADPGENFKLVTSEEASSGPNMKKIIPNCELTKVYTLTDPITDGSPNLGAWELLDKKGKTLGFVREIRTDTGCNLYCRPLHYFMVFDPHGKFMKLQEVDQLTKKNHALFTPEDYLKLDMILSSPPAIFSKAKHSLDLVDALTRETLPEYKNEVVPEAALTSFRTYQYLIQTQSEFRRLKLIK